MIVLVAIFENLRLFAEKVPPFDIGSGDPTLHIIYNAPNQYIVYLNQPWPLKNSEIYSGGYAIDSGQAGYAKRRIILCSSNSPTDGHPHVLYPFDENLGFTCPYGGEWSYDRKQYNYFPRMTQVFCTNEGDILISDDVYSLARSRYGLTTNQLFLGKIGTNIYYWEMPDTTKVYYRPVGRKFADRFFKLPKSVIDLYGVTMPFRTNMDIAVWTHRKHHIMGSTSFSLQGRIKMPFSNFNSRPAEGHD